jgi:hypothetical protein
LGAGDELKQKKRGRSGDAEERSGRSVQNSVERSMRSGKYGDEEETRRRRTDTASLEVLPKWCLASSK